MPSTTKLPASAPVSVIAFTPAASSVTTMSATLIRLAVLVFSGRLDVTFESDTAVGASLMSVTRSVTAVSRDVVASAATTVNVYTDFDS